MILEVDVEPFAAGRARLDRCDRNETRSNALPPCLRGHHRVYDEGVDPTVPRHIDEADEFITGSGADPAEAARMHLPLPVVFKHPMAECLRVERVHLSVVEVTTPFVRDSAETILVHTASSPFFPALRSDHTG